MPRVSVQPALFAWARQRARLDEVALAARFPQLADWESGAVRPTLRQLEQYAKATHAALGSTAYKPRCCGQGANAWLGGLVDS